LIAVSFSFGQAADSGQKATAQEATQARATTSSVADASPNIYEDEEIRILVPAGWKAYRKGTPDYPALLLTKKGYTLSLNNGARQLSAIAGGRFYEVFSIPWLQDATEAGDCGVRLLKKSRPTTGKLLYFDLVFETLDAYGRRVCGIPKDLVFERRWFAGYFSTDERMWLFDAEGDDCGKKAYTLTSMALTPGGLPKANDPILQEIVGEAVGIVNSIHYKKCPPARGSTGP